MGRPTILTDELIERFCREIEYSGSIETAISMTGIGRGTYYDALRQVRKGEGTPRQRRFIEAVQKTESNLKERRFAELAKRRPAKWTDASGWLARHYRAEYGPKHADRDAVLKSSDERVFWEKEPGVSGRSKRKPSISDSELKPEEHGRVVIVDGDVEGAKPIKQGKPVYPSAAFGLGIEGVVVLGAIVKTDGAIGEIRLLSGDPLLSKSAVRTVKRWMYSPPLINGEAAQVKTTIRFKFTLS